MRIAKCAGSRTILTKCCSVILGERTRTERRVESSFFSPEPSVTFFDLKKMAKSYTHTTHIYNTKDFFILSIFFSKKATLNITRIAWRHHSIIFHQVLGTARIANMVKKKKNFFVFVDVFVNLLHLVLFFYFIPTKMESVCLFFFNLHHLFFF